VPLVFSFHGSGGVPQSQVDTSGFHELADRYGFAVVFPAGAFTNSITARSWNANVEAGVDDVQFVRDMIEDIAGRVNIDRSRIYTSGFSGGGRISSRLACELSDVLAAAAPVAGLQYPDDCTPARPIPIITFHAVDDPVNTYAVSADSRPYWRMGVETALDKWRQANGCSLANDDDRVAQGVILYTWSDCPGGAEIDFYQTTTGGHTWPGAAQNGAVQAIDASALIWEFFSRQRL
jgi:polyhydroxybutyrate depolymerase